MSSRLRLLVVAAGLLLSALALSGCHRPPADRLTASGTIEADEVEISPQVAGRLARLLVDEGDRVERGQVVARLDPADLQAQVNQAQGAFEAAQAQLRDLQAGSRAEQIRAAQAQLAQARSAAAGAQAQVALARENLRKSTALAGQVQQARANREAATAALAQARARLSLVQEGTREEQIRQAQANLDAARAALVNAEANDRRAARLLAEGAISAQQRDAARQARDSAQAAVDAAQARLQEAQTGPRSQERQQAEEAVRQAEAGLQAADAALRTAEEAYADRLEARTRVDAAETQYRVSQDQARAAQAQLELLQAGATQEAIKAAQGRVEQARGALELARRQLSHAVVRSPLTGVVLTKVTEPGELVTPGQPIVTAAALDPLTLRIYVPESDYGKVHVGDEASVTVDSYPGEQFEAKVVEIANQPEFTPRNIQTQKERVKLVFGIKLQVSNPQGRLKPGMPADAVVRLAGSR